MPSRLYYSYFEDRVMVTLICSALLALFATGAQALPGNPDTSIQAIVAAQDRLYLVITSPEYGRELWVYQPGEERPTRLTQADPGRLNGVEATLVVHGDTLYYPGYIEQNYPYAATQFGLWCTRGAPDSTRLLTDALIQGWIPPVQAMMGMAGDHLYFIGDDGVHGRELWRSDGTPAGTFMIGDLTPPNQDIGTVIPPAVAGEYVVFRAAPNGNPGELWRVELSGNDPQRIDVPGLEVQAFGGVMLGAGQHAYFIGRDEAHGRELWVTDGTANGTRLLSDILPGPEGSEPTEVTHFGDMLLCQADDGVTGRELWRVDTESGEATQLVDISPGKDSGNPYPLVVADDAVYFTGTTRAHGRELWVTRGTPQETRMVRDIRPGEASSGPYALAASGGHLFFSAHGEETGEELWYSDGSEGGTKLLADIYPGPRSSEPYRTTVLDGIAYFQANDGRHGVELWRSDGTPQGTWMVTDLSPPKVLNDTMAPRCLAAWDDKLFYVDRLAEGAWGWFTRTSPESAPILLARFDEARARAFRCNVVEGGPMLRVHDGAKTTWWRSQGTKASTVRAEKPPVLDTARTVTVNGIQLTPARVHAHGVELCRVDTPGDTPELIVDLYPGPGSSAPRELVPHKGEVYFVAETPNHGTELFVSDGTTGGTRLAEDFLPGAASGHPRSLVPTGEWLYLVATHRYTPDDVTKHLLWRMDVGSPGTELEFAL